MGNDGFVPDPILEPEWMSGACGSPCTSIEEHEITLDVNGSWSRIMAISLSILKVWSA